MLQQKKLSEVSSNNLTLTSSMSGNPVQPKQREHVELETVDQLQNKQN